jgi:hypothetical protein
MYIAKDEVRVGELILSKGQKINLIKHNNQEKNLIGKVDITIPLTDKIKYISELGFEYFHSNFECIE